MPRPSYAALTVLLAATLAPAAQAATVSYNADLPNFASDNPSGTVTGSLPGFTAQYEENISGSVPDVARSVWDAPNSTLDPNDPASVFSYIRRGTVAFDFVTDAVALSFVHGTPSALNVFELFDDGASVFTFDGGGARAFGGGAASTLTTVTDVVFDELRITSNGGGPAVEFGNLAAFSSNVIPIPVPAAGLGLLLGLGALAGLRRRSAA